MSRYVITITPETDNTTGAGTAHTTMRIDMSTGQTRITELTVQAANGEGLAPADLPPIDLDLLVRALTAPTPPQALRVAAHTDVAEAEVVAAEPAAAPRRRPRKTAAKTARKATKKSAAKAVRGKSATGTAARSKATKATKTAAPAGGTRAYRRMPDPDQVMEVYNQTGSITAVAEHFDVPRHTVAGWARRLRTLGHTIGRQ